MHISVMAAREQRARERVLRAAEGLAGRFGLVGPAASEAGPVQGRDRRVVELLEREAVAEFLEGLLAAVDARDAPREEATLPDREALRDRLLAVKGIGAAKAEEILDLIEAAARRAVPDAE
jgi:hypothetical protein